ncbi:unnamed protein product [Ceutorhynchus assimilis]|uniref:Lipocalin/cytosolic fatty-acid binding domain-containing protein n=1 Tax=Ceutorhynchus assimilis TaxID=467358 RepID=A0A9N9MFW8_9CUCU|nr:unnamed protein product [Ceutorhynchus assimilis]
MIMSFSTGVKRVIGGNLDLSSKRTDGKMVIKYNTAPISTTSTLAILDTDYDNYAVIYSCGGFGPVNAQSAWLMTRERIPDAQTLQKAYGVLDRYKINRSFFVKTDQEGCAIAASDLNAALGIASTSTNVEQTAAIDSTSSQRESVDFKAQPIATIFFNKAADEYSSSNKKEIVADKEVILPIKTDIELLPETTSLKYSKELVNKVEEKPSNETKASENFIENHEEEKSAATVVLMKPADTNTTSENILEQN